MFGGSTAAATNTWLCHRPALLRFIPYFWGKTRKTQTGTAYVDSIVSEPEQRRGTILEPPKQNASSPLPAIKHVRCLWPTDRDLSLPMIPEIPDEPFLGGGGHFYY